MNIKATPNVDIVGQPSIRTTYVDENRMLVLFRDAFTVSALGSAFWWSLLFAIQSALAAATMNSRATVGPLTGSAVHILFVLGGALSIVLGTAKAGLRWVGWWRKKLYTPDSFVQHLFRSASEAGGRGKSPSDT